MLELITNLELHANGPLWHELRQGVLPPACVQCEYKSALKFSELVVKLGILLCERSCQQNVMSVRTMKNFCDRRHPVYSHGSLRNWSSIRCFKCSNRAVTGVSDSPVSPSGMEENLCPTGIYLSNHRPVEGHFSIRFTTLLIRTHFFRDLMSSSTLIHRDNPKSSVNV